MENPDLPVIAAVGLDAICSRLLTDMKLSVNIVSASYDGDVLENAMTPAPSVLLCGVPPQSVEASEVAQSLRMHYPEASIYYVSQVRETFHRPLLRKNGFSDAFLLPNDLPILHETISREIALLGENVPTFRTVQMSDVEPGEVLGFDLYLYLPANQKYVKVVLGDCPLDEVRAGRLRAKEVRSVYVSENQMPQFYSFTARQLKKAGSAGTMSETEKREKRSDAIRNILTGVLSESSKEDTISRGRQIVNDCREIVREYIVQNNNQISWYESFLRAAVSGDNVYLHAATTSTFAALISIGLGIGDPEELALAGLLHDIGLSSLPLDLYLKDEKDRTPEEQSLYEQHPLKSVDLIKEKKMIVPENVMKLVQQHHERYDGRGYPAQVPGDRLSEDTQILAFADLLDELMVVKPGRPTLSIPEAVNEIAKGTLHHPEAMRFHPDLLRRIVSLFPEPQSLLGEVG